MQAANNVMYTAFAKLAVAETQLKLKAEESAKALRKPADGSEISENAVTIAVFVLAGAVGLAALAVAVNGLFTKVSGVLSSAVTP